VKAMKVFQKKDTAREDNTRQQKDKTTQAKQDYTRELSIGQLSTTQHDTR
jgi:hypothetical protein